MRTLSLLLIAGVLAAPLSAQSSPRERPDESSAEIDFPGFLSLSSEVQELRQSRLLGPAEFLDIARQSDVILLDTRSAAAFAQGHIKGAINLPFSDFTEESLRAVIGDDPNRRILIYCNNNFTDDVAPVRLKKAPLALNIPTFINLYGYGYTNVWELRGEMSLSDMPWVSGEENAP